MEATAVQVSGPGLRARRGDRFVLGVSVVLLVVLVAAFARSFYFRAWFEDAPLSQDLVLHGTALSLWYVWLFAQSMLITTGRREWHRRMGMLGAGLALIIIATGITAVLGVVPRVMARSGTLDENMLLFAGIFWGNGGILFAFAVFVTLALVLRRRPDAHKRLMLLASIAIAPPALHRVGLLPFLRVFEPRDLNALAFMLGGLFVLLASLVIYDLKWRRRLHPVTAWSAPIFFLGFLICIFLIPPSPLGQASAKWLVSLATA